jgi:molybdate transport system permease protein
MNIDPILISLKTASVSIIVTFIIGTLLAYWVHCIRSRAVAAVLDAVLTLPLVLPPTVAGFMLLYIFGVYRPVGALLMAVGIKIVFTWWATVIAATVVAMPLMYRSAKAAFDQVDEIYLDAARTIGISETQAALKVLMPLARPGLVSGGILAFSRALGEFGATALIAGNIAGQTRTMPLAIYSAVNGGDMEQANGYVLILVGISLLFVLGLNAVYGKKK